MEFAFNTGRMYTAEGQRIKVRYDPVTGVALFADVSRLLDGRVSLSKGLASEWLVKQRVLEAYDESDYSRNSDSLQFLNDTYSGKRI